MAKVTTSITTSTTTTVRIPDLADVPFQCFVFSWWSQWGLFMGSLFCLCVHVLVGGSICPSLTSAALALWSCSLCFSSLFSVLVWGLPSMFFRNFRRSGRWWVAWVATTNACAEQVTHTTSTSSSVGNPNFFCTSLCTGCFCCCKVWAATLHLRSQAAICKIVCLHRPSTLHHLRVLGFGRCPSGWIKGSSGSQANEVDIIWLPPNTVFCWKALAEQNNHILKSQNRLLDERNSFVHICSFVPWLFLDSLYLKGFLYKQT